jgi:hypothetical protein
MKDNYPTNNYKVTFTLLLAFITIYFLNSEQLWLKGTLAFGLVCLVSPFLNNFIASTWMKFSKMLSLFFPKIILSLFYLLILTPTAQLSKIIGRKKYLSLENNSSSLFKVVNKSFDPKSFEKMW